MLYYTVIANVMVYYVVLGLLCAAFLRNEVYILFHLCEMLGVGGRVARVCMGFRPVCCLVAA